MEINIDKLLAEAVTHMSGAEDVRWSIGMALQEMHWHDGWKDVQERLVSLYNKKLDYDKYYPTEEEFSNAEIERIITLHDLPLSDDLIKLARACFAEAKIKEVTA